MKQKDRKKYMIMSGDIPNPTARAIPCKKEFALVVLLNVTLLGPSQNIWNLPLPNARKPS